VLVLPLLVGILVVLLALMLLGNVVWISYLGRQGFRLSKEPPSSSPGYEFVASRSQRITGGVRVRWIPERWPFAAVTLDDQWAFVSGFRPVWVERKSVVGIREIRTPFMNGVLFESLDSRYDGLIFWGRNVPLIAALERFGWPAGSAARTRPGEPS